MYIAKFNCEFVNLVTLYRQSDRYCPPSEWKTLLVTKSDVKNIAQSLGDCAGDEILISRGRGATASCWVHPRLAKIWVTWASTRRLKSQSNLSDVAYTQESIPVEVEAEVVNDNERSEHARTVWQPEEIEVIVRSDDPFPVSLDKAWGWVGYTRKDTAKEILVNNFKEGIDYREFPTLNRESLIGRPPENIGLTKDCFEHFCLMAGTKKGKEIRAHFIQCRRELIRIKSQPQPAYTTNADSFISMIESDLEQMGVGIAFIKSWKYDSLKALHPQYAKIFDDARRLIMANCAEQESRVNVSTISDLIDSKYNLQIPAQYLNQIWVRMGFQAKSKTSKCKWILTDVGKEYGLSVPYHNEQNRHDGFQILWLTSIVDITYEYLKTQKQENIDG